MATAATGRSRPSPTELYSYKEDGGLGLNFHPGQRRAWHSRKRFVAVLAGTQGGKTAFGPWWLDREIDRRGPGDYLAVTATYDLFKLKMLPAMREVFEHVTGTGRYWAAGRVIEIADPETGRFLASKSDDPMYARVILRSAEAEGGLESTTAKAAWLDEAGQDKFQVGAWHAVLRRLSLSMGRCLFTTTLYNFGWLKTEVYDRWAGGDPDFDVINFDSTANPLFPRAEWERAKSTMPPWRFRMQYQGVYERPAGMIYDCFVDSLVPHGHLVKPFTVPPTWPRYLGLDFGGANTAGVFLARDPLSRNYYAYREYLAGGLKASDHARALTAGEPPLTACVGGSPSEGQWRKEFAGGGLDVLPPAVSDVELGISRVYGAVKDGKVFVFDNLPGLLGELRSYSRKLDAAGQPTQEIDKKAFFHRLDAVRYLVGWLEPGTPPAEFGRNVLAGYRGAVAGRPGLNGRRPAREF